MDPKGCIRHIYVNDNGMGRDVEETIRVLQGLQFTDETGKVCPAGWKKGGEAFLPTTVNISKFLTDMM